MTLRFHHLTAACCALLAAAGLLRADENLRLWYEQPAAVWTEALPVGNGSLGAMIYGGIETERLQFNEDTLWTGAPHGYHREGAVEVLDDLRQLLDEGKQDEAHRLGMEQFMSVPLRQTMYQPFGDVWIDFSEAAEASDYQRDLDLTNAIANVRYTVDGVRFTRETFSSYPDNVIVHRITADQSGAINIRIRLSSEHTHSQVEADGARGLILTGQVRPDPQFERFEISHDPLRFAARLRVLNEGGRIEAQADALTVSAADAVTIVLSADTQHRGFRDVSGDPAAETLQVVEAAMAKPYDVLRHAHVSDYRELFDRVSIDLGTSEYASWPTDKRLERTDKSDDPQLAALFYQYGRFLLIASSRPGAQPANLQGIWNDQLEPPWGSKYTLNINAEMNYWPAEMTNLSELHEPFFSMIDELVLSGRETARAHYGAKGWVVHHNTDLWRGSAPINHANHGIWPGGGAWLSQHLWERFQYTQDNAFLAERAYPVMKEAAEFFVDYLVEDSETGWLISGPSNSPEHGGLVMGPAMDHQLIRSLFGWVAEAAALLDRDAEFAARLTEMRARIAPNQIGRHGQLQEWLEDKDDPENQHRHVSHLWAVFPGDDITWEQPGLMRAARQSLLHRGDGGTGWALGWKVALWARFLDGDHSHRILMNQFNLVRDYPGQPRHSGAGGVYPNLFDAHPPFQIDGNFAATAGITEMLVQSHRRVAQARTGAPHRKFEIVLLPALPSAFPAGSVSGIRARGGYELDFAWEQGQLTRLTIRSEKGGEARLRHGSRVVDVILEPGQSQSFGPGLRNERAYDGERSPIELSKWMLESQASRFQEWLPEGRTMPGFWDYSLAIVGIGAMDLARHTGDDRWADYAAAIFAGGDAFNRYRFDAFNIDFIKPGSPILDLYQHTGDKTYLEMAQRLRQQMREQPRISTGGFWHKNVYPWQMWLDGIYMGSPFLAQYAAMFDEPDAFDDVVRQIVLMDQYAWDADKQLHHHAYDEKRQQPWADPETGLSSNFWGRSSGWYGMAIVDVLDFLPQDHPGRPQLIEILGRWAEGVVRWQDAETGLWWQVMDRGDHIGNYLEATASTMFVYTFTKAMNHGYLPRAQFSAPMEKGWKGIQSHLLDVDSQGRIGLAQCCRVAGLSDDRDGSVDYYLSERVTFNDLKGVGPFIRLGLELEAYGAARAPNVEPRG